MGVDNNAIFGYGFIIKKIKYEDIYENDNCEDYIDKIKKICSECKVDFIHDRYWHDYEIFIGIVKNKVQNGINTYSKENGWNSKKDKLSKIKNISFEINDEEYLNVNNVYKKICKFNESEPCWQLFTFNT